MLEMTEGLKSWKMLFPFIFSFLIFNLKVLFKVLATNQVVKLENYYFQNATNKKIIN